MCTGCRNVLLVAALAWPALGVVHAQAPSGAGTLPRRLDPMPPEMWSSPQPDYDYLLDGPSVRVMAPDGTSYTIASPCPALAAAADKERLYIACGESGVAVFSLAVRSTPELLGVRDLGAPVMGLHKAGGVVWAEIVRSEARRLTLSGPLSAPILAAEVAPAPPFKAESVALAPVKPKAEGKTEEAVAEAVSAPTPTSLPAVATRPQTMVGHVLESAGGMVVIDLGAKHGLGRGDHVAMYRNVHVALGAGEAAQSEELLAIGKVAALSAERAQVELGRDEVVPVPALARLTREEVTASRLLPPRPGGTWEMAITVRPFLALGSLGAGMVSDAAVGVRFDEPVHLQAVFQPLGLAFAKGGNVLSAAGNVIASYDTRLFEIGLGAGWSAVNANLDSGKQTSMAEVAGDLSIDRVSSGLSLAQVARLGAQDGISLLVRNTFILYKKEFRWGDMTAAASVPVSEHSWLVGRGGGGTAGSFFGELGLRQLLWGNGHRDSGFVSASLGFAGLSGQKERACAPMYDRVTREPVDPVGKCYEEVNYSGPMVGLGFEWRL